MPFTRQSLMAKDQYGPNSQGTLPGFSYQQHSLVQSEAARNMDDLNRTTHSAPWCCTLVLVIIGFFFCPALSAIGLVFAIYSRDLEREASAQVQSRGVLVNGPRHSGLADAEKYNSMACHLGVAAIIAGTIILGTLVAVLLFLNLSEARILVSGSV